MCAQREDHVKTQEEGNGLQVQERGPRSDQTFVLDLCPLGL